MLSNPHNKGQEPLALGCWKQALQDAIRSVDELLDVVELPELKAQASMAGQRVMPTRVPRGFVDKIRKGDPQDPLFLQVFPAHHEERIAPDFVYDPLQEMQQNPAKGIIHKYPSRALLIANGACAIHCRYCFRRGFDYHENSPGKKEWQASFDYLRENTQINEVILSGGDPLLLPDSYLRFFIEHIQAIPHIKRLRIHTRVPVVLPERITPDFVQVLTTQRLQTVMVVHVNHPNEIIGDAGRVLALLSQQITLLNQSTLLKGVNDSPSVLAALSEALFACGVLPYYLHTLDKVAGAGHFYLPDAEAYAIHQNLQSLVSGFLVPKLVKEVPHRRHKVLLSDLFLESERQPI